MWLHYKVYSRVSHYVNEIPFNIIVGLPFSPLLLPFIVTTCPDIWRSLTLNSRYASPVKKKGNAEESEACVDRASTFLKEDLPKKAISPLEKKIIWISKVGKKSLLIKVIHFRSFPPQNHRTSIDPNTPRSWPSSTFSQLHRLPKISSNDDDHPSLERAEVGASVLPAIMAARASPAKSILAVIQFIGKLC